MKVLMRFLARDVDCKNVVSFTFSKYLSVYKRRVTHQNADLWVLLMTLKLGYIWMWLSFISQLILVKAFDKKLSKMQSALKEKGVV